MDDVKQLTESELFHFLVSMKVTENEAQFVWALLEEKYEGDDFAMISIQELTEAIEYVRKNVPEDLRRSILFGVN